MKKALMVAEKPSLAQSIANLLSNGKCVTRKGANHACSVHEWNGTFKKYPVYFKMTSVCGHVMSMDFIGKFNNWNKVDPAELFHCTTEKKEANPKLQIPKLLYQEAKGCDYLILWLDCDKEGENICFEVIDCVAGAMNRETGIYRARFSSITETEVKAAMEHLVTPNENEARSVDARQELDLRIGCAFTRYQTKYFQGKYGDLDSSLISFGPCQTPTLGFCVDRHDHIQGFKPEPYWVLQVNVEVSEGNELALNWERGRCFDKEVAHMFLNLVKDCKTAGVLSITKKEQRKLRPQALNTVELMRSCSSGLGMGPHHAMQIAEKLYIQGYISYPRTETTQYSSSFDLKGALNQQKHNPEWGTEVSELLNRGINPPRKGTDVGDHPPITPMRSATPGELDSDSWKIYEFITRYFIGSLSHDCKYLNTTLNLSVGDERFNFVGKTLIEPGFTSVMTWQAFKENETVPDLAKGTQLKVNEKKLVEKQTSPPDHLSESELITLMEKHGIGTDASIPVHINNICQRNYVQVTGGRRLVPTTLGIVLVHGYQKIDHDLVLPTMRSAVENQLNLIAQGKANFSAVLSHTLEIFKLKFQHFVSHIEGMDQLFEVSFSPLSESGRAMCRCGKCHRYMRYVQAKPSRLHCTHCGETYSLPQNGIIKLYKEQKCPLDDFELLHWSGGTKGKSYPFCPYCYNNPPFREMKKSSGCDECSHPTCRHSFNSNGVASCPECESGILVLDPFSCPKWKLSCNKCDILFHVFDDASKVTVLEEKCDQCNCQQVSVEYKTEKSRLPDGQTEASGCIFCLPHLQGLIEKHHAINKIISRGGNRGGQMRGRGRGGTRGRGRGRGKPKRPRPKDKMAMLDVYFV